MSVPIVQRPYLLNTTIVPDTNDLQTFLQFLTRLYEDIAFAVNQRDFVFFPMAVPPPANLVPPNPPPEILPQQITNMPLFGSFVVCVSGEDAGLPCATYAINKADIFQAGVYTLLSSQAGNVAPWIGFNVTIQDNPAPPPTGEISITISNTSTMTGNFNIRIIGTQ